jgi:hypothetical protein
MAVDTIWPWVEDETGIRFWRVSGEFRFKGVPCKVGPDGALSFKPADFKQLLKQEVGPASAFAEWKKKAESLFDADPFPVRDLSDQGFSHSWPRSPNEKFLEAEGVLQSGDLTDFYPAYRKFETLATEAIAQTKSFAYEPMAKRDVRRQEGCSPGGKISTRTKEWAVEAAEMLNENHADRSAQFCWERIPNKDDLEPSEFTTSSGWTLYRAEGEDGQLRLFAENDHGPGVSFRTFRGYFSEIRKKKTERYI